MELDGELIKAADDLKLELDEEKKERERVELEDKREKERLEKLERERVEREAAVVELEAAVTAAKASRDATTLSKPIKRARKAAEFDSALLKAAEDLKAELA